MCICYYLFTRLRRKISLEPFTWVYQTSWSCRSRHYLSSFCSMVSIKKWKKDLYIAFSPIEFEKSLTGSYYPWDSCIGAKPIPSYKAERVKYLPRSAFYHIGQSDQRVIKRTIRMPPLDETGHVASKKWWGSPREHSQPEICVFFTEEIIRNICLLLSPLSGRWLLAWSNSTLLSTYLTGRHNLQSFLAANSTQNYFLIARMLSFLWHSRQAVFNIFGKMWQILI